jgi:hypothetical protein
MEGAHASAIMVRKQQCDILKIITHEFNILHIGH